MEREKFEQLLGMASGYVLDFTNRTFAEFILESTGRDIYDPRYDNASGSKAHRLRMFWKKEDTGSEIRAQQPEICRLISQSTYRSETNVYGAWSQLAIFQVNSVSGDEGFVER